MPLEIFKADRSYKNVVPTFSRYVQKMMAKWVRPKHAFPFYPFLGAVMFFYMIIHKDNIHWHKRAVHHW